MKDPIQMLRARRKGRTLKAFSEEIGCTEGYLSLLLNGHREPGAKIMEYLGLKKNEERHVTYSRARQ